MQFITLGYEKTCAALYIKKCYYTNSISTIHKIRFIARYNNPPDIGNIQPYHLPATITKVVTTERNIIYNKPREKNNTIMVINSTEINTAYPRANTNYLW